MKKTIALFFILVICFSLVGCGNEINKSEDKSNGAVVENNNNENEVPSKSLGTTYQIRYTDYQIDAPEYREIGIGYTELFINGVKYVAVTNNKDEVAVNPKEAHEIAFAKMKISLDNYEGGINSLTITKDEMINVNGLEVYSYEGTVNYGTSRKYDAFAKGYAFIIDGIPHEIFASVHEPEQRSEDIKEVSDYLDEMIKTVRIEH